MHYSKYAGWKHMFWNEQAAVGFIAKYDTDFLQVRAGWVGGCVPAGWVGWCGRGGTAAVKQTQQAVGCQGVAVGLGLEGRDAVAFEHINLGVGGALFRVLPCRSTAAMAQCGARGTETNAELVAMVTPGLLQPTLRRPAFPCAPTRVAYWQFYRQYKPWSKSDVLRYYLMKYIGGG